MEIEKRYHELMTKWEEGKEDSGVAVAFGQHGPLTLVTRTFGLNGRGLMSHRGIEAFGLANSQVQFMNRAEIGIPEDLGDYVHFNEWIITGLDGIYQHIFVHPQGENYKDDEELTLEFSQTADLRQARGIHYHSKGDFFVYDPSFTFIHFKQRFSPNVEVRNQEMEIALEEIDDQVIMKGCVGNELVEVLTFPTKISKSTWMPRFLDNDGVTLIDPNVSCLNWFEELGVTHWSQLPAI